MKKKILSLVLALAMVLPLVPAFEFPLFPLPVFATENNNQEVMLLGEVKTGTLSYGEKSVTYRFTPTESGWYHLRDSTPEERYFHFESDVPAEQTVTSSSGEMYQLMANTTYSFQVVGFSRPDPEDFSVKMVKTVKPDSIDSMSADVADLNEKSWAYACFAPLESFDYLLTVSSDPSVSFPGDVGYYSYTSYDDETVHQHCIKIPYCGSKVGRYFLDVTSASGLREQLPVRIVDPAVNTVKNGETKEFELVNLNDRICYYYSAQESGYIQVSLRSDDPRCDGFSMSFYEEEESYRRQESLSGHFSVFKVEAGKRYCIEPYTFDRVDSSPDSSPISLSLSVEKCTEESYLFADFDSEEFYWTPDQFDVLTYCFNVQWFDLATYDRVEKWISSNEDVVKITETERVNERKGVTLRANFIVLKEGTSDLTVTLDNGVSFSRTVTVKSPRKLQLDQSLTGKKYSLETFEFAPEKSGYYLLELTCDNPGEVARLELFCESDGELTRKYYFYGEECKKIQSVFEFDAEWDDAIYISAVSFDAEYTITVKKEVPSIPLNTPHTLTGYNNLYIVPFTPDQAGYYEIETTSIDENGENDGLYIVADVSIFSGCESVDNWSQFPGDTCSGVYYATPEDVLAIRIQKPRNPDVVVTVKSPTFLQENVSVTKTPNRMKYGAYVVDYVFTPEESGVFSVEAFDSMGNHAGDIVYCEGESYAPISYTSPLYCFEKGKTYHLQIFCLAENPLPLTTTVCRQNGPKKLEVLTLPDCLDYVQDFAEEAMDLSGLTMRLTWDDGTVIEKLEAYDVAGDIPMTWTLDEERHTVTVSYAAASVTFDYRPVPNPVDHLELLSPKKLTFIEHYGGYDYGEGEAYCYNYPDDVSAVIRIYYKDGKTKDVGLSEGFDFRSENGYMLSWTHNQEEEPWTVGEENKSYFTYLGHSVLMPVEIVENPIEKMEYVGGEVPTLYEGANGSYEWYWDEEKEEDVRFWRYHYSPLDFSDVKIKLTYKDGSATAIIPLGASYNGIPFEYSDEQFEKPWTYGDDNPVTVTYLNHTLTLPVRVAPSRVEKIEIKNKPSHPIAWGDLRNGLFYNGHFYPDWEYYMKDFSFLIYYTDREQPVEVTYEQAANNNFYYNGSYVKLTYISHWPEPGVPFEVELEYHGFTETFFLDVVESPVKEMRIKKMPDSTCFNLSSVEKWGALHGLPLFLPNFAGLEVELIYRNGETKTVQVTSENISSFSHRGGWGLKVTADDGTVLLIYGEGESDFAIYFACEGQVLDVTDQLAELENQC